MCHIVVAEFMEACIEGNAEKATRLVRGIPETEVADIINRAHKTQNSLFHRYVFKEKTGKMFKFLLFLSIEVVSHERDRYRY